MYEIRQTHASDLPTLYRICLETGLHGNDATALVDAEILGHYFVAPYFTFGPELCFTLTLEGEPVGYIVGTDDTRRFDAACEQAWWPVLRARYQKPDSKDQSMTANMVRAIHERAPGDVLADQYPAHLHINLLPLAQGNGQGKSLISTFCRALNDRDIAGLHLGVSPKNQRALAFYSHLGFEPLKTSKNEVVMGTRLSPEDFG